MQGAELFACAAVIAQYRRSAATGGLPVDQSAPDPGVLLASGETAPARPPTRRQARNGPSAAGAALASPPMLRRLALVCGLLIIAGSVAGVLIPAGLGWDFANFYDAGAKALNGQIADLYDPTADIAGRPPQGGMAFFSAPVSAYLYAPLALLPAEAALIAFKLQNVLAIGLVIYLVWRRGRPSCSASPAPSASPAWSAAPPSQAQFTAALLVLALLFQPFWTIFRSGGQSMPTALLLLTLGWAAHERRRFWTSATCFVAAAAIKPFLAPGLLLLMAVSGSSFLLAAAGVGLAAAALSVALLGWPIHVVMLQKLASDAGAIVAPQYNSGLLAALDAAWLGPDFLRPGQPRPPGLAMVGLAIRAAVFAALCWMALRARKGEPDERLIASWRYLLALMLPLFVTPVAWEHYLTLLFPALAIAVAGWPGFSPASRGLFVLFVIACLGRNLVVMMWFNDQVGFATKAEQVTVSLFNSIPTLLALAWLLSAHRSLCAALRPGLPTPTTGASP